MTAPPDNDATSSARETAREGARMWVAASKVSYIGIFFGVAIAIGFFGGRWLDGRLGTAPWLSIVGLLIGIAAGFRELVLIAQRVQRDQARADADEAAGAASIDPASPPTPPQPHGGRP